MVEGPMDFYLKELIMPSILEHARTGNWIGITNGIDFTSFNPFNDILLIETFQKIFIHSIQILLFLEILKNVMTTW